MQTASAKKVFYAFAFLFSFFCFSIEGFAQAGSLTGKVTDQSGTPLAGATVYIKGTGKTTTTNDQGRFSFSNAPGSGVLIVTYVGQEAAQTTFTAGQEAVLVMKELSNATDEVVVTGVFDRRTKLQSSVAISTINSQRISQLAPTSAADLLKNVPGIYVNNARGEISNTVYSRGISANSIDNASGYYYVSMQEDGLPVSNAAGTDNYIRADITTARLEAVRGGTASIFGANAPGGIFNYISKTGGPAFEGEARAKIGLEGDGRNPYYRADLNVGGPFKKGGSVTYNLGGFFRLSQGARYPGYWANNGGQLKANLVKNYDAGSLKIYGKWLDDRNATAEFIPSADWSNPHVMTSLSATDSYWLPAFSMQVPVNNTGSTGFHSKDKAYNQSKALGLSWNHNLGDGWTFRNDGRFSNQQTISNVPAVVTPFSTQSPVFYGLPYLLQTGKFGTYTFTDKVTGQQLGTMTVVPGPPNGLNFIPGPANHFPGANIQPNSLFFLPLFYSDYHYKELMDQFSFSKKLRSMTFNFGSFLAHSKVTRVGGQEDDGVGVGTLQDKPHLVDIKLHELFDNQNYQITDPNGFMDLGRGGITTSEGTKRQAAFFLGHNWDITSKLNLDWGLRYEQTHFFGSNTPVSRDPRQNNPSWGGTDGNPLTVYDNGGGIAGAALPFDATVHTVSYSAGLNYKLSNEMAVYARYSNGNKAPELGNYFGATNPFLIKSLNSEAQNIKQVEAAFKLKDKRTSLTVTPFYSLLSHVPNLQFAFQDSLSNNYNPPTQYGKYRTYGLELEGGYAFSNKFSVRGQATLQNSKAVEFTTWISSGKAQQYDQLVSYSGNETDNNARLIFGISPAYTCGKFNALVNYYYMGSRQANIPNAFKLPAFGQLDLSLGYDVSKRFRLQANINNLLNKYGVLGWSGPGGFPAALNRQGFSKEFIQASPNAVFATQGSMPRAYFLTASVRF